MRVLLLSDVHANWEALLALQRTEPKPDAILFAGDAVGYGPDPLMCVRWLLAHVTLAVRGNHDHAMNADGLFGAPGELEHAARETLGYARRLMAEEDRMHLGRWPAAASITLGDTRFFVTHGTPADPLYGRLNPATHPEAALHSLFGDIAAGVIVLGHTHMPAIRRFDNRVIVNPGSLGQPRHGSPDATYAVWEDGHVQIKHLHYDYDSTAHKLRLLALSPEAVDQLSEILQTGMAERA